MDGFFLQVADALDFAGRLIVDHEGEHRGNRDLEVVLHLVLVDDGEGGERRGIFRLPQSLHGGELHGLDFLQVLGVHVAGARDAEKADEREGEDALHGFLEEVGGRTSLQDLVGGDGCEQDARRRHAREERMRDLADDVVIREERAEVRHDGAAAFDGIARRMLHEGVGDDDPERREVAADGDEPHRHAVEFRRQFIPAEDPDAEERRLKEEGGERLQGERCTEDVAHEARVLRPVHAEVELLYDARDDTHGEVDEEDRAEELQQLAAFLLPLRVLRADMTGFEKCQEECQPQRQRDEEKMIRRGDGKLPL